MEKITISTVPVRIRVIEVGGKRMTISVFNQIQEYYFFDPETDDEHLRKEFLGWVSYKEKQYILFYRDGTLCKDCFEKEYSDTEIWRLFKRRKEELDGLKTLLANSMARNKNGVFTSIEENINQAQMAFIAAAKERDEDHARVNEYNSIYQEWLKPESQIFIAI